MIPKLDFAEWLKQEMTSTTSIGSSTSTADIANFARPLFSGGDVIKRQWANTICGDDEDERKCKKHKKD